MSRRAYLISILAAVLAFATTQARAAELTICGTVNAYVAATPLTTGLITIAGQPYVIAAGVELQNRDLITSGANVCLTASLTASGQITTPATVTANVTSTVEVCGVVSAYAAASAVSNGSVTIGGRTIPIAAGTQITNHDLISTGANLCLHATLNGLGQLVAPSSVTANASTTVALCGVVTGYAAATTTSDGSLTIAGRRFAIAAGTTIGNSGLIQVGVNLCLDATLNAAGQIIVPSSVRASVGASVRICGTVNGYAAATGNSDGSITIDGRTYTIAAGTTIDGEALIVVGVRICLEATIDQEKIVPPTRVNRPPVLTVPGPQTVAPGHTLRFSVSASDPDDGDVVRISAAGLPPNSNFTPHDGNPARGEVIFTPSDSQRGQSFTVQFTANDGHGGEDRGSVDVTVTDGGTQQNQPPVLHVPDNQTVRVGSTLHFSVSANDPDAADVVHLSAGNIPQHGSFAPHDGNPATGDFTFTPDSTQTDRTFVVTFTADDGHGHAPSDSVSIRVIAPEGQENHPPILSVPGPQVVAPAETLRFRVTATDPDGDAVTLSSGPLPPHAQFNPPTGDFTMTPSDDQVGQKYIVDFIATDPKGASSTRDVEITVVRHRDSQPPTLSVPPSPIVIEYGDVLDFDVIGTSQTPGCDVQLGASGVPQNATFNASGSEIATGRFHFTPSVSQEGDRYVVMFRATDCQARSVSKTVTIIVVPPGGTTPGGDGQLCVGVAEITFSPPNGTKSCSLAKVTLFNHGHGDLQIKRIRIDNPDFQLDRDLNDVVLPPGMSVDVGVVYDPASNSTNAMGAMSIESNDPTGGTVQVLLRPGISRTRAVRH